MNVVLEFDDELEFQEFWDRQEHNKRAGQVLGELHKELRDITKYAEPTPRDTYWHDRFWELCREYDLDGWGV